MEIGIFGGSFNPPHKAHFQIAKEILNQGILDKILFVPTGDRYNKEDLIPNKYRYEMLKMIAKREKNISVSNFEQKHQLVFAYQTLDHFQSLFPLDDIYLICGSDNWANFTTWKKYQYILKNYKLIVNKRRPFFFPEELREYEKKITFTDFNYAISSTILREELSRRDDSEILRRHLDKNILKYIRERHLYERKKIQIRRGILKTL